MIFLKEFPFETFLDKNTIMVWTKSASYCSIKLSLKVNESVPHKKIDDGTIELKGVLKLHDFDRILHCFKTKFFRVFKIYLSVILQVKIIQINNEFKDKLNSKLKQS